MSVLQTALIFGGIPLAIVLCFVVAVYGRALLNQPNRYRPGRAWTYPPVWYIPNPEGVQAAPETEQPAIEGELRPVISAEGGASGEW